MESESRQRPSRLSWWALVGIVAGLALAVVQGEAGPVVAPDNNQARLDQPAPIPDATVTVSQTFVAGHDGLASLEFTSVVYPATAGGTGPAHLTLRLRKGSATGVVLAEQDVDQPAWPHNAPLRFDFPSQAGSAGQTYTVELSGRPGNRTTVWMDSLDSYLRGQVEVSGRRMSGALTFQAYYDYDALAAIRDIARSLGQVAGLVLPLWLVLFAPGLAVLGWLFPPGRPLGGNWTRWGLALSLSLALVPLLWEGTTVLGLRWSPGFAWGVAAIAGLAAILTWARTFRARRSTEMVARRLLGLRLTAHDMAMFAVLAGTAIARGLAVRDLALPPWVDSPHHALITELFKAEGQVPQSYQPYLPVSWFNYHYGWHALTAWFSWLTGLATPDAMLWLGQALNALVGLAAYALVVSLTGRKRTGLIAAFFVGFVSLFPSYYISWGRYTQLAGLTVLCGLLAATVQLLRRSGRDVRCWLVMVGLLSAGLTLTHYRVVLFYGVFAMVALAWYVLPRSLSHGYGVRERAALLAGRLMLAGGLVILLCLPWLVQFSRQLGGAIAVDPGSLVGDASYNAFPAEYFQPPWQMAWLVVTGALLLWAVVRRAGLPLMIATWTGLVFAGLNGDKIGLPTSWVVNNNSWAISLFVPGAILVGWGIDDVWRRLGRNSRLSFLACGILAGYLGLGGIWHGIGVVNPATVQATAADREAMVWIAGHTPPHAVFAMNGYPWLNNLWTTPDGGAWLVPLTGRQSTMPPLDYGNDAAYLKRINAFNQALSSASSLDQPEVRRQLDALGVTYLYLGARPGHITPEMALSSPSWKLAYSNGAVWVFVRK